MTLETFLASKQTNLATIVALADAQLKLRSGEALLAVGSLVEGLGSSKSDVDLLWITPRADNEIPPDHTLTLVAGRCLVDVRLLRESHLQNLLGRFTTWCREPWDVTREAKFSLDDRVLLHRLLRGRLLNRRNPRVMDGRRPVLDDLARLKLHMARHASRTIQVDMIGYREAGDYRSLVFAAQEVLGHAVDGLLAGYRQTNPQPRWRSRILGLLPPNWERALRLRPSGLTPAELHWHLHRAPERPDASPAIEHAARVVSFSRAAFLWAERQLLRPRRPTLPAAAWPRVKRRPDEPRLPYLELDVDFAPAGRGIVMGRLNEFGESVALSAREFAAVLLFDGLTTMREGQIAIRQPRGAGVASRSMNDLIARLDEAKFILRTQR